MTLWLMTLRIAAVALLTVVSAFWMPARAQGNEPVVYVFWGQSCPYSQRMMTYIKKMRKADPKLQVQDYEVEGNPANAAAHERVLEAHRHYGYQRHARHHRRRERPDRLRER